MIPDLVPELKVKLTVGTFSTQNGPGARRRADTEGVISSNWPFSPNCWPNALGDPDLTVANGCCIDMKLLFNESKGESTCNILLRLEMRFLAGLS
jgi:hypothetical protein